MASRLPPAVVKQWSGLKNQLKPDISKMKMPSDQKSQFLKAVTKLYGEFDQGLSKKMKEASSAPTDAAAKTALAEVVRISATYLQKLDKFVENPNNDMAAGGIIHTAFKKALANIHEAAELTHSALR